MLGKLLYFLQFLLLCLPHKIMLRLGRIVGLCSYVIFQRRRKIALQNFSRAFDSVFTPEQIQENIKQCFVQLGLNVVEFLCFPKITPATLSQWVTFHGLSHLETAYAQQRGVLVLTAHIGHWELLAAAISLKGFNTSVVVKKARQNSVNYFLDAQRKAKNLILFCGKNLIRPILQQLKQGGIVGIVLDQSASEPEGVTVSFFNRPAHTLKSLAVLSLRTQAPVVPIYIYRDAQNHHHIVIAPPLEHTDHGIYDNATITARTQLYTTWLENIIRQHPSQWIWTHRRWKKN